MRLRRSSFSLLHSACHGEVLSCLLRLFFAIRCDWCRCYARDRVHLSSAGDQFIRGNRPSRVCLLESRVPEHSQKKRFVSPSWNPPGHRQVRTPTISSGDRSTIFIHLWSAVTALTIGVDDRSPITRRTPGESLAKSSKFVFKMYVVINVIIILVFRYEIVVCARAWTLKLQQFPRRSVHVFR